MNASEIMLESVVRDSVFGIATCCGLDGPGIEARWGRDFLTIPYRLWDPHNLLYSGHHFSSPRVKGRGATLTTHPHPSTRLEKE
jgi:hypothetical protein